MAAADEIFVGRQQEIDALSVALDEACAGSFRLALISGEPGIGKTRTVLELLSQITRRDAGTYWGRCHEEAGAPPYWPWAQILRALVSSARDTEELSADLDAGAADIVEVVPEISSRLPDVAPATALSDPSEARFRLFSSIARLLINLARRKPWCWCWTTCTGPISPRCGCWNSWRWKSPTADC